MESVTTIGLDIAESVFQVHGVDAAGRVVVRRQLKRRYVLAFFEKLSPGRSLQTRGREAALRQRARRAIARGEPARDRIPYQRMGIVAWAVVTDVTNKSKLRVLPSQRSI